VRVVNSAWANAPSEFLTSAPVWCQGRAVVLQNVVRRQLLAAIVARMTHQTELGVLTHGGLTRLFLSSWHGTLLSRALALAKVSLNSEPFCIRVQLTGHSRTRRKFSAKEKIRIVLDGLRGEMRA